MGVGGLRGGWEGSGSGSGGGRLLNDNDAEMTCKAASFAVNCSETQELMMEVLKQTMRSKWPAAASQPLCKTHGIIHMRRFIKALANSANHYERMLRSLRFIQNVTHQCSFLEEGMVFGNCLTVNRSGWIYFLRVFDCALWHSQNSFIINPITITHKHKCIYLYVYLYFFNSIFMHFISYFKLWEKICFTFEKNPIQNKVVLHSHN